MDRLKRFVAVLALGAVFASTVLVPHTGVEELAVYAAEAAYITFQGTSEKSQASVSLLVFTDENPENIAYFDQSETNAEGDFCFNVNPAALPEDYTAQVKVAGEEALRIYTPDKSVVFEDFEDYTGGYSEKWSMSGSHEDNFTAAVDVDEKYGSHLKMQVTDGGTAKFAYYFAENLPFNKVYRLSFSAKSAELSGNFYIRLLDERYTTDNAANDDYMHESFCMRRENTGTNDEPVYSKKIGYYQGTAGWTVKELQPQETDAWYDIDMWLDSGKQRIFYAVDGNVLAQTDFDTNGNDLKGMLFTYSGAEDAFYIDNIKWEETDYDTRIALKSQGCAVPDELMVPVELSVESERTGNIFFDSEPMALHINANNLTGDSYTKEYLVIVKDVKGNEVRRETVAGDVAANAVTRLGFTPEGLEYGVYDIEIYENSTVVCRAKASRSVRSSVKNPDVGICTHIGGRGRGDATKAMELIEALGVGYTRDDWTRSVQVGLDEYSDYFETDITFSKYLDESAEHDVNMLALINTDNKLYVDGDGGFCTSDDGLTAMYNYCKWLAGKFKGRVRYYEIGNEVNYKTNNDGKPAPASDYVKVLDAAYKGIKAGDNSAKVIAFGGASIDFITNGLNAMVADGNRFPFDGISVHPYHIRWDPEKPDPSMDGDSWIGRGNTLKALIASYEGLEDKEIWATELGYYTQNSTDYGKQTETNQAAYLLRMLALNAANDFYDTMFVFEAIDGGTDITYKEHNFGILNCYKMIDTPYSAKAAYPALSFWNSLMSGAVSTGIEDFEDGSYNAKFDKNGSKINVLWNYKADTDGKKIVSCRVNNKPYEVYDMYGNLIASGSGVTDVSVEAGEEPVYVVVRADSFELLQGRNIVKSLDQVKNGDKLTFKCKLTDEKQGIFIAAMYKDNVLVDAECSNTSADGTAKVEFTYKEGCNRLLMTAFDNLENIKPIVEAVNINQKTGGERQ